MWMTAVLVSQQHRATAADLRAPIIAACQWNNNNGRQVELGLKKTKQQPNECCEGERGDLLTGSLDALWLFDCAHYHPTGRPELRHLALLAQLAARQTEGSSNHFPFLLL